MSNFLFVTVNFCRIFPGFYFSFPKKFRSCQNFQFLTIFLDFYSAMKHQILQKVKTHRIDNKSKVIKKRSRTSFHDLPTEMKDFVIQNLSFEAKGNFRATSSLMKKLVDDQQRRELNKWKESANPEECLNIDHFTSNDFTPPILKHLIEIINLIRVQTLEPLLLYCKEKLVTSFYDQAQGHFDGPEMKLLFTLTMLAALKHLTNGVFSACISIHCRNLELSFAVTHIYFGIPWARKSDSTFNFEEDGANFLTMLTRMLWMKKVIETEPESKLVNTLETMDFNTKLVVVGSRVKFNRPVKKPSTLKCRIRLEGDEPMIEAFRSFMSGTTDEYHNFYPFDSLMVEAEFISTEARKCEFKCLKE